MVFWAANTHMNQNSFHQCIQSSVFLSKIVNLQRENNWKKVHLKEIPILLNPIEPSTCSILIFDVALFFNLYFSKKSLNDIIYFPLNHLYVL